MIDYDNLRKKAEAAKRSPIQDWIFDDPGNASQELDRIAISAGMAAAEFISHITPSVVLLLLDIIAVATETLGFVKRHSDEIETVGLVTETLDEIAKIEKE